ncbi:MAG: NAD(P)-binding protein, partial [Erythrobacter sp.]
MNAETPITPTNPTGRGIDPAMAQRYAGKKACVIGAGFGGMALAIRLQSHGIATTVVEAR